jgi:Ser/Thr protein kinase RdoA (MazF antagonist)
MESPATVLPFQGLEPEVVMDAIDSTGLRCDGRLHALNSYENRVYQVGIEDGAPIVAKFYRPGRWSDAAILEEHAFMHELAERELPVVEPMRLGERTLQEFGGFRFSITPRCPGRAPDLDNADMLEWMGRFIGRIHAVAKLKPFEHRETISVQSFGVTPRDWLLAQDFIPAELLEAWTVVAQLAINGAQTCFDRAGDIGRHRLHGDCHAGNILWRDDASAKGPFFVDFDDCRTGPAMQDLWMLLSGDRISMQRQLGDVLAGYEDFCDFDPRELHLIEALRTLRLLHYSGWLAQRWDDPAFKLAFPWFNTVRYWQDRILELREQVAAMQEPPLVWD